jgi:hypothetical protein
MEFMKSQTRYISGWEKRADNPVFIIPGLKIDTGSGRVGKVGITRDREGKLCLVKSDVSAPTSRGRCGCRTKWIEMHPMEVA